MKRLLFPLLLLLLALPLRAAPEPPATGAQRLTTGANLHALQGWPSDGTLLALRVDGARQGVRLDVQRGTLSPDDEALQPLDPPRLTVEVEGVTHRLLLDGATLWQTEDEVLGRPTLAPDGGWLVIARVPRGNETAALGELWRYDLAAETWTPLTANGVEESSPVISPDGGRVAFLRAGDAWTIPADGTTPETLAAPEPNPEPLALANHTPPAYIRVKHVASGNTCRDVPDGDIERIPFEEYVKRVVPHESPASWHMEALKAQAVAARTYAWYQMQGREGEPYDVTDTTAHQYMCDTTTPSTNAAVDATAGQHLTYHGGLISAMFSAENSSPTKQNAWGHGYLSAVDDPRSFGYRRNGHGQGYSQWGGKRWADAGWSYRQILRHYYTGAQLEPPAGDTSTLLDAANRPTTPWLRGSAFVAEWNAPNGTESLAREWKPDGGGTLQPGPWLSDATSYDGWQHSFSLQGLPDLALEQYRVEANTVPDTVPLLRPVLRLGIDRTAPTLAATLTLNGAGEPGDAVPATLTLSPGDAGSGVERVGWGFGAWQREAEATGGATVIADATASGGQALRLDPAADAARTLLFPRIEAAPGHYRLWFRLRTDAPGNATRVATLRLFDDALIPLQRGVRYLHAADFAGAGWEWFFVDIDTTSNYGGTGALSVTPHIEWHDTQRLDVDRFFLATRPDTLVTQASLTLTLPEPLMVFASDAAGNIALQRCEAQAAPPPPPPPPPPNLPNKIYLPLVSGGSAGPFDRYVCAPSP